MYRLSRRSLRRLDGIDKILIKILKTGIKESPYDFGIPLTGGLRTAEDQNRLFSQGVSRCDGYRKKSYHQTGNAFDIYIIIDGKATWDRRWYKTVADHLLYIAKTKFNIDLTWGNDWDGDGIEVQDDPDESFSDAMHFQI